MKNGLRGSHRVGLTSVYAIIVYHH